MTRQERFQAAVRRCMAASPFADTLIYLRGSTSITLADVLVHQDTNALEVTQEGAMPEHVLECRIDKARLAFRPDQELDRLQFKGRTYKFKLEAGDVAASPVWCLAGRSPMK